MFDVPLKDPAAAWPTLQELLAHTHIISLPLNTTFRGVTEREAAIFTGGARPAEFSPFLEYNDAESATWLAAALNFGYGLLPDLHRERVPVNATVPAVAPHELPSLLERYGEEIHTVKIKVAERGQSVAQDLERVRRVRDLLPDAAVRIDANGGYEHAQAVFVLTELADIGLEYAEQPVAGIAPLAQLRHVLRELGVNTKIAADEAVRKAADPLEVARQQAADLLVLKAQPLGGIHRVQSIVHQTGLPAVISSALDTGVGIAMGARLAASLPELPFACGLATGALFTQDVLSRQTRQQLYAQQGYLNPVEPEVDEDALLRWAAPEERQRWWHQRIRDCYRLLEQ